MHDFTVLPDLALDRWGGAVLLANDEFFAPRDDLVKAAAPVWKEGLYTERGKWMDGWETRRRRKPGHDWCILRLGMPGMVHGVVVDTAYFTGNYPESCSIDATELPGAADEEALHGAAWTEILPRTTLEGNYRNMRSIDNRRRWTHLRFVIYPDGGVARLRVHGEVVPDWSALLAPGGWVDLAAQANGGRIISQSDAHYGHAQHMLQPERSSHMGDGWETRRRRGAGHDWAIVRLARPGYVKRIEVDTDHYKGNAPGACSLDWCSAGDGSVVNSSATWMPLLDETPLLPNTRHAFSEGLMQSDAATHVRLNIFPDGGIARLRLLCTVVPSSA
jgi:allantoicase